jgi:MOSC domain-containing protein YiiM
MTDATDTTPGPTIAAVSSSADHSFSKPTRSEIRLVAGLGVEGDAHSGVTNQHRPRIADHVPNLRQVHLMHAELFDELALGGFTVGPGELGENVTTHGVDLLGLPRGTRLRLGADAVVELTGLRDPCRLIDGLHQGLMRAVFGRDADGNVVRKSGVMAIVLTGGLVRPGDPIGVELPARPHEVLAPV